MAFPEVSLVSSLLKVDFERVDALEAAVKECRSGSSAACAAAAAQCLSAVGDNESADAAMGKELAEAGCSGGNGLACFIAAAVKDRAGAAEEGKRLWLEADRLLSLACKEGRDEGSCFALGIYLHSGAGGLERDSDRALALLDVGCEEGNKASCITAGMILDDRGPEVGGRITNAQANLRYKFACDYGSASACHTVGERMEFDLLVEEDDNKKAALSATATEHYRRGCDLGKPEACSAAGTRLVQEAKPSLALPYLLKAAEADDPAACLLAGMIYGYGQQEVVEDVQFETPEVEGFSDMEEEEQRLPGVPITSMAKPTRQPSYKLANYEKAERLLSHCCTNLEHSACCDALEDVQFLRKKLV